MYWLFDALGMAFTILVFIVVAGLVIWLLFATPFGLLLFLAVLVIVLLTRLIKPKKEY